MFNKNKWRGSFLVTTDKGRIVADCCAIEQARYVQDKGRTRLVWQWDNLKNKYFVKGN